MRKTVFPVPKAAVFAGLLILIGNRYSLFFEPKLFPELPFEEVELLGGLGLLVAEEIEGRVRVIGVEFYFLFWGARKGLLVVGKVGELGDVKGALAVAFIVGSEGHPRSRTSSLYFFHLHFLNDNKIKPVSPSKFF